MWSSSIFHFEEQIALMDLGQRAKTTVGLRLTLQVREVRQLSLVRKASVWPALALSVLRSSLLSEATCLMQAERGLSWRPGASSSLSSSESAFLLGVDCPLSSLVSEPYLWVCRDLPH